MKQYRRRSIDVAGGCRCSETYTDSRIQTADAFGVLDLAGRIDDIDRYATKPFDQ